MKEFEEFLRDHAENIHTRISYTKYIGDFLKYFNIETPAEAENLTASQIREYRKTLMGKNSASTVNTKFRPVSSFYNWMWKQEYITNNPMKKVERLKEISKPVTVFTDGEYQSMLNACENIEEELMIRLTFEMGLRTEDLTKAKKQDIKNGYLYVDGKGQVQAKLEINEKILSLISKIESDTYLLSRGGKGIGSVSIWKRFRKIMYRSGIPDSRMSELSTHKGRHWFVSTVIEKTGDINLARELARHKNIHTTQRYAHGKDGQRKEAMNAVSFL